MKIGFIYLWYDRKRKMYYIGSHWGTEDDGYICSSNRMRDAYRRRPQDFKRRIIQRNIERSVLLDEEYRWFQYISDEELGKKYYNLRKHKWGHWSTDENKRISAVEKRKETLKTSEPWKKYTKSLIGRSLSDETKQKLRESAEKQFSDPENRKKAGEANLGKSHFSGKTHSKESRKKMSESLKGHIPWNKGKTGMKHSEETKEKMRGPRGPYKKRSL